MRNALISCIIFVAMVLVMGFSVNYVNKICTKMEKFSDDLEIMINNGQWEEAYDSSNNLLKDWENYSLVIPIIVNHAELDILNNEMLRLTQYIKCETKEEALASTHVIKFYLDNVKKLQKINIQNIF